MSLRHLRTHWRPNHSPQTFCGREVYVGTKLMVCYAEYWPEYVDCLVCLYHMGRYMPLVKLQEHQDHNKIKHSFQKEFFKPQPLVGL
jgi:hypothetical protein